MRSMTTVLPSTVMVQECHVMHGARDYLDFTMRWCDFEVGRILTLNCKVDLGTGLGLTEFMV